MESQIPPVGENHLRPNRPLPALCLSAIITVPSFIPSALRKAFSFAIILVDSNSGK